MKPVAQRAIAAVFLLVGVLAAYNTWQLQSYVKETLPRDAAQEQCITDTVAVLKQWLVARGRTDQINNDRDDALIAAIDEKLIHNGNLSPEQLARYRSAVTNARQAREILGQIYIEHPLPEDC